MSFSGEVKKELSKSSSDARHCQIAEFAAILLYAQAVKKTEGGRYILELQSDMPYAADKSYALFQNIFKTENRYEKAHHNIFKFEENNALTMEHIFLTIKYAYGDMSINPLLIKSMCCKRAYLRGAFLAAGSMSNPEKGYHLEFVCENEKQAGQLIQVMEAFEIKAKSIARKRYRIVYIKESEEIVELLNVMGAHISLMNLENLRILKDVRNSVNRKVNCETANIKKTVNAATKQIEDIQYIKDHYGFDNLNENLRQAAQARLDYPDATLKELGERLVPPVGKSGVNHRFRKLSELSKRI